jgi:hypothetical protein
VLWVVLKRGEFYPLVGGWSIPNKQGKAFSYLLLSVNTWYYTTKSFTASGSIDCNRPVSFE